MRTKAFYLIISISILLNCALNAQRVKISGFVTDAVSGEPLIGAYVINQEISSVTTTNNFGFYSTTLKSNSDEIIIFRFIGYKTDSLQINAARDTTVKVLLTPGISLKEVSVTGRISRIENREQMSLLHIQVSDFKVLPSFVERDAIKSLQLLPGVASGAEGQSGLNVRGGSPDQNLFLVDGIALYHVNHLGNYLSVFETEALKDIKLFKGAFPARYGSRLSSIVDIRIKEGNKYSAKGNFSLGLISGSVLLEGPIKKGKSSYLFSFRRFWPDILTVPLSSLMLDGGSVGYNFYDNIFKINNEISEKDKIYFSFYFGRDSYNTVFREEQSLSKTTAINRIRWGNILFSTRWTHVFGPDLFSEFTAGYTNYSNSNILKYHYTNPGAGISETVRSRYFSDINDFNLNTAFEYTPLNKIMFRFGGGAINHIFNPGTASYKSNSDGSQNDEEITDNPEINAIETSLYLENEIKLLRFADLNLGIRWSGYKTPSKFYNSFEPRFSTTIRVGELFAISTSYSKMQQYIHLLSNSGLGLTSDLWMPSTANIVPEKSDQFAVGISKTIGNTGFEVSIEGYVKKMTGLITFKEGAAFYSGTGIWEDKIEPEGTGDSKGLEILLQKIKGKTTGWISYTLSKSTRHFNNINLGMRYPYKYDRLHDLSVVLKRKLDENIDFSATWVYGSGLPITLATGKYQTITTKQYYDNTGSLYTYDEYAHLYEGKNSFRMRDYHRLDVGINFNKKKKKGTSTWSFNIYNVYNRQNPLYYYIDYPEYKTQSPGETKQMKVIQKSLFPIMPTITYSFKF
jgi:hypothetical protein